jgi:PadR family transcriptional regulator PadR
MWLGKFLDIEEDINELRDKIEEDLFDDIKKNKMTPLEFTIIETIFNSNALSGYDLILNLNKQFAGTWEAKSGTIYPILTKLERDGFLKSSMVKSPIGPLRKVYYLTEAGEELLKFKVYKNFTDQLKFVRNFLVELASIYIKSFPEKERENTIDEVGKSLKNIFNQVIESIPSTLEFKSICNFCGAEITRKAAFCPSCGASLMPSLNSETNSS